MIEFLGNSVYEIDLSHIEAVEILQENYDHIHRFVKLIYEWTLFQTGNHQSIGKKHIDLWNSEFMPTVDTYGNINNGTQSKTDIIDFYNRARPELKIDCNPQGPSKFRILSSKQKWDSSEIKDIFKNTAGGVDISSRTQSLATSVNTTILWSNGNQKSVEDWKLLNPSIHEESSYERSLDKGIIRSQVSMIIIKLNYFKFLNYILN